MPKSSIESCWPIKMHMIYEWCILQQFPRILIYPTTFVKIFMSSVLCSMPHCVIFWNCRFLTFYQEPIKIYLLFCSSKLVSHFLLRRSLRSGWNRTMEITIVLSKCECQAVSLPLELCPRWCGWALFFSRRLSHWSILALC